MKTLLATLALLTLAPNASAFVGIVLPPHQVVPPHDCDEAIDPDRCEAEKLMLFCMERWGVTDPETCIEMVKEMICDEVGQPEHPACGGIGALERSLQSPLPVELIELFEDIYVLPVLLDPVVFENSSANIVSVETVGNDVWYTLDPVHSVGDDNVFYAAGSEYTTGAAQLQVIYSPQ